MLYHFSWSSTIGIMTTLSGNTFQWVICFLLCFSSVECSVVDVLSFALVEESLACYFQKPLLMILCFLWEGTPPFCRENSTPEIDCRLPSKIRTLPGFEWQQRGQWWWRRSVQWAGAPRRGVITRQLSWSWRCGKNKEPGTSHWWWTFSISALIPFCWISRRKYQFSKVSVAPASTSVCTYTKLLKI